MLEEARHRLDTIKRLQKLGISAQDLAAAVGDSPLLLLRSVAPLPALESLLSWLRQAAKVTELYEALSGDSSIGSKLLAVIRDIAGECQRLRQLAENLKLGRKRRWDVPPPDFWMGRSKQKRHKRLELWEGFGDGVTRIYDLIAPHLPAQRRRLAWGSGPVPTTLRQGALELTADCVNHIWAPGLLSRPFTAQDVKNRLASRHRIASG